MSKNLVIVESPAKARTISRFLGSDFVVEASFGHVRDLPKSKLGVDIEHDFAPQYIIPRTASPRIKKLRAESVKADRIILATDEDREGEAIAWHLAQALSLEKPKSKIKDHKVERIVFHEITKSAIEDALRHPRAIDMHLVDAQQARRILDRLVGYKLSPFLWKKLYRGLSAGRVQSAALRLIVEREREIRGFNSEEYWTLVASFSKNEITFDATLAKIKGETIDKFAVKNQKDAEHIVADLTNGTWTVAQVEKKTVTRKPPTPFITSTLQQDAFRRLGFSARQTMRVAQQLYEGVELGEGSIGLITYMRTDSLQLSEEALTNARAFISKELGNAYLLPSPRKFKTKVKGAQEAHEAIRPTDPHRTPESVKEFLDLRQFKLYNLIWRRFFGSQLPEAVFDATIIDINAPAPDGAYTFRANGQTMKFDGFLALYPVKFGEIALPEVQSEEALNLTALSPLQHFTEPPARFSEASLIKILEKHGIGRPSTYAPIVSTILDRSYVERHERKYLKPTDTGFLVNDLLVEHFPAIVDVEFTAKMEEELDRVASGEKEWTPLIKSFYEPFEKNLMAKYEEVEKHQIREMTDEQCEKCGKPMMVKLGRFGKFLACSGFPECKTTKTLKSPPATIGMKCPTCTEGDIIIRYTKKKRIFYGCSRYPKCDYASWTDPREPEKKPHTGNINISK